MGTAVLHPQDCLPISNSRHRSDLSDMFMGSPIAMRNTVQFFDYPSLYSSQARHSFTPYHGVGPLYLDQARHSFAPFDPNTLQRAVEQRKPKLNRLGDESRAAISATIPGAGVPSFTILRRPKEIKASRDLIAGLLIKPDTKRFTTRVTESRLGNGFNSAQTVFLDRKKKNGSNGKKGSINSEMAGAKFRGCKLGQPKFEDCDSSISVDLATWEDPKTDRCKRPNFMTGVVKGRRSCDNRYDNLMPHVGLNEESALDFDAEHQSLRTMKGAEYSSSRVMNGIQPSRKNSVMDGLTRLRRASTDPQIVEHLGRDKSHLLEIDSTQAESCHGFTRSTSMSLPERWAGPAYFSSPAPSSLPLPKFTLLGHKTGSLNVPPVLGEQQKSNITKPVELGSVSVATGSLHVEGELDVAFATKSLRRMLKLDPS